MDSITAHVILNDRTRFDPMMKRLKKMRASRIVRTQQQCEELFHKVKAIARNGRMDWLKGKVRWFTETEEFGKIRAHMEVEKSIGRSEPQLWNDHNDHVQKYRHELNPEKQPARYTTELTEQWQHQIDPMLLEDLDVYSGPAYSYSDDVTEQPAAEALPSGKDIVSVRRVRGSKSSRARILQTTDDQDIVKSAESLVEEIRHMCDDAAVSESLSPELKLICQDDYVQSPTGAAAEPTGVAEFNP